MDKIRIIKKNPSVEDIAEIMLDLMAQGKADYIVTYIDDLFLEIYKPEIKGDS